MSVATANAAAGAPAATVPEDHVIVLFGTTGDLARRKLLPGIFHLTEAGLMPERFRPGRHLAQQPGGGRVPSTWCATSVEESGRSPSLDGSWDRFAASLRFAGLGDGYEALGEAVAQAREDLGGDPRLLHYLSLPPAGGGGHGRSARQSWASARAPG